MPKEIYKKDLYAIIGVSNEATEKEILKGYRKRALKCHPDKNPDNPNAAALFHELSQALEILTDAAARSAYDQSLKAKKAAEVRNLILDSKRKKFKDDLEAREKAFSERSEKISAAEAEKKLKAEVERLRKEGSKLLEQEQQRFREKLKHSTVSTSIPSDIKHSDTVTVRLKLKWKALKSDPSNGGYNKTCLQSILRCYGRINTLLISSQRNGSALVEFDRVTSDVLTEKGLLGNPLTVVLLSGKPSEPLSMGESQPLESTRTQDVFHTMDNSCNNFIGEPQTEPTDCGERDFESLVLMRMRQAEERKKLREQLLKEDCD